MQSASVGAEPPQVSRLAGRQGPGIPESETGLAISQKISPEPHPKIQVLLPAPSGHASLQDHGKERPRAQNRRRDVPQRLDFLMRRVKMAHPRAERKRLGRAAGAGPARAALHLRGGAILILMYYTTCPIQDGTACRFGPDSVAWRTITGVFGAQHAVQGPSGRTTACGSPNGGGAPPGACGRPTGSSGPTY